MSRYREVADIVLKYLEHRDRLVRLSITSLLPRIAHFLRDRFVTNYLKVKIASFCVILLVLEIYGIHYFLNNFGLGLFWLKSNWSFCYDEFIVHRYAWIIS